MWPWRYVQFLYENNNIWLRGGKWIIFFIVIKLDNVQYKQFQVCPSYGYGRRPRSGQSIFEESFLVPGGLEHSQSRMTQRWVIWNIRIIVKINFTLFTTILTWLQINCVAELHGRGSLRNLLCIGMACESDQGRLCLMAAESSLLHAIIAIPEEVCCFNTVQYYIAVSLHELDISPMSRACDRAFLRRYVQFVYENNDICFMA